LDPLIKRRRGTFDFAVLFSQLTAKRPLWFQLDTVHFPTVATTQCPRRGSLTRPTTAPFPRTWPTASAATLGAQIAFSPDSDNVFPAAAIGNITPNRARKILRLTLNGKAVRGDPMAGRAARPRRT
jgi:hypothetical protein